MSFTGANIAGDRSEEREARRQETEARSEETGDTRHETEARS
jgi:hypothetical protein